MAGVPIWVVGRVDDCEWLTWVKKQCAVINKQMLLRSTRSFLPFLTLSKALSSSPSTAQCAERWVQLPPSLKLQLHVFLIQHHTATIPPFQQVVFLFANVILVSGAGQSHRKAQVDQTWHRLVWYLSSTLSPFFFVMKHDGGALSVSSMASLRRLLRFCVE